MKKAAAAAAVALCSLVSLCVAAPWKHQDTPRSAIALEIGSHGDLMRRDRRERREAPEKSPAEVKQDGLVSVVTPATGTSEQLKLEELTEECMHVEPTAECMEKFGSYGVRKFYTENWYSVEKLGYERPGWMSHPMVQKKKLFEVTLPASLNSGSYSIDPDAQAVDDTTLNPYGVVTQNFNFYQQLKLGVRQFDISISYNAENQLIYVSSRGTQLLPLATVLRDIRRFLEEHEREVIVIEVKKDPKASAEHLKPLIAEETSTTKIPGQLVHEAVQCELKEMLAIYTVLSQLPTTEEAENPTIGALTDIKAQVIYFYETQQVLCVSRDECLRTPGWYPSDNRLGGPYFAFGPPLPLGHRVNMTGSRATKRMIEPACLQHSGHYTQTDNPEKLAKKIEAYVDDMPKHTEQSRPACFPAGEKLPSIKRPTIWYAIDGVVTSAPEELAVQTERMRGIKAIYTRGEGFTVKTEAERTNYLLLNWLLKRDNQERYTAPNAIYMEFVGSAYMPIIRIIEAEQGRPECGWAVHCKESGSCWADTLLGKEDMCIPEEIVMRKLKYHADGYKEDQRWIIYTTIVILALICCCCISTAVSQVSKAFSRKKGGKDPLKEGLETGGKEVAQADVMYGADDDPDPDF